jgi:hypothetical protein
MDLSAAEIPQRLIQQLFELDADYAEALWALDQSPAGLDLRAMLRDTLAALEQLPDAPVRFRKTLPPMRPLHAPGLGTVCPQVSRTDRGLQHGSGQRSPQRLISQEITRVNKVVDRLLVECHDCGEKTSCIRLTAQSAEPETGYRDEMDLCAECWEKREASRG